MQHNAKTAAFILPRENHNSAETLLTLIVPAVLRRASGYRKFTPPERQDAPVRGIFYSLAPWSQNIAKDGASVVCRDESCETEKTAADVIFCFRVCLISTEF